MARLGAAAADRTARSGTHGLEANQGPGPRYRPSAVAAEATWPPITLGYRPLARSTHPIRRPGADGGSDRQCVSKLWARDERPALRWLAGAGRRLTHGRDDSPRRGARLPAGDGDRGAHVFHEGQGRVPGSRLAFGTGATQERIPHWGQRMYLLPPGR